MAQLSLYRRYRPRRFSEIRGQDHVVRALRNAVATGTESHAYLFSGPRGTGKTSTARILAKALNCEALAEGEPCGTCESCQSMDAGRSFDLFELDAASNNGVDAVRDLVERAAVGSPGRTKVYILDEVHMLTAAASNALLKTLEEPPDHVRFVLATTDPQKVLPTIRSRTQHYEFQLLSAKELEDYVRWIVVDADLGIDDEAVAFAVRQGRGSARDTLSALDQVVAAGGVHVRSEPVEQLFEALIARDAGVAITAVAEALAEGHDPRVLAEAFLVELRSAFLLSLGAEVSQLVDADRDRLVAHAKALGTAALTRSMEAVGVALVDMRQAADPRVPLEVALVRLTAAVQAPQPVAPGDPQAGAGGVSAAGTSAGGVDDARFAALQSRVEHLEATLRELRRSGSGTRSSPGAGDASGGPHVAGAHVPAPAVPTRRRTGSSPSPATQARPPAPQPAAEAAAVGVVGDPGQAPGPGRATPPERTAPVADTATVAGVVGDPADASTHGRASTAVATATGDVADADGAVPRPGDSDDSTQGAEPPAAAGPLPERDALVVAFGDVVVQELRGIAKALFAAGRFVAVTDSTAVFAFENGPTRERARQYQAEVEALLAAHFGRPVPLRLVTEAEAKSAGEPGAQPAGPPEVGGEPGAQPAGPPEAGGGSRPAASSSPPPAAPAASVSPREPKAAGPEPVRRPPPVPPSRPKADGAAADNTSQRPPDKASRSGADDQEDEMFIDLHELEDANDVATTGIDKLTAAFPGAELIEEGGDDA